MSTSIRRGLSVHKTALSIAFCFAALAPVTAHAVGIGTGIQGANFRPVTYVNGHAIPNYRIGSLQQTGMSPNLQALRYEAHHAERVALLEIHWPRTGETQVFRDIAVNQGLVVTESEAEYQTRHWKPIPLPE